MILAVDIGNTRTKAAVFQEGALLEVWVLDRQSPVSDIAPLLSKYAVRQIVLASVTAVGAEEWQSFGLPVYAVNRQSPLPFFNAYGTPDTLGIDRMVLASGATLAYPKQHRLVIDAGTCVTYDFVDADDRYHGGAISPGLRLRYEALHRYTAKLPLLHTGEPTGLIGDSTAASIHSGVVNGLALEIDGFIASLVQERPNFTIILTGGDTEILAKRLKNTIFAHPNFLLESLVRTFQYAQHDQ
ncbi:MULTISPECIES: type III pantothenate kinase [unclassified Flavobacterium]|uniref:type III pantothenate kinase n=1 Tax=unclassified Flavobacterium TaxID=196869 RepID=UPI001F147724|nr:MULTISPECIES: type III pantothenate kinase [unclassified Flavobacterium]UMY65948.1 type III pantothenate kinase [Flavobacterium sp. HJ-32-4]